MKNLITLSIIVLTLISCSKEIYLTDNNAVIYDEFWNYLDQNYIYFDEKDIDWDAVYTKYAQDLDKNSSDEDLKLAIESSLLELKDGHNWLSTPDGVAKVYDITEGFDIHFDKDLIYEKYLGNKVTQEATFSHGLINDTVFYVHVPQMQNIKTLKNILSCQVTLRGSSLI